MLPECVDGGYMTAFASTNSSDEYANVVRCSPPGSEIDKNSIFGATTYGDLFVVNSGIEVSLLY